MAEEYSKEEAKTDLDEYLGQNGGYQSYDIGDGQQTNTDPVTYRFEVEVVLTEGQLSKTFAYSVTEDQISGPCPI